MFLNQLEHTGNSANTARTFIENDDDYDEKFSSGISNVGGWVAKFPGELGNNIRVSVCPSSAAFESTLTGNVAFTNNSVTVTGNGTGNRMAWWTSSTNITEGDYYASTGSIGSENGTYPDITAGVLKAESSVKLKSVTTGTGDYDLQINTNGYLRKTSSSQRYKENIAALSIDSAKIYNLTAKSFKWIDTTDQDSNEDVTSTVTVTGKNDFGLIAEEVHLELPELITYDDQNRPDAVNYKMLSVLLIEELKKLEARVKTLEGG